MRVEWRLEVPFRDVLRNGRRLPSEPRQTPQRPRIFPPVRISLIHELQTARHQEWSVEHEAPLVAGDRGGRFRGAEQRGPGRRVGAVRESHADLALAVHTCLRQTAGDGDLPRRPEYELREPDGVDPDVSKSTAGHGGVEDR